MIIADWMHEDRSPARTHCIINGCNRGHHAKGLCDMHYRRWKRTGSTERIAGIPPPDRKCIVDGCDGGYVAKGMCRNHYVRFIKYGSTELRRISVAGMKCTECGEPVRSKGLCAKHYQRWCRKGRLYLVEQPAFGKSCTKCGDPVRAKGLCHNCYQRDYRKKHPPKKAVSPKPAFACAGSAGDQA